MPRGRKSAVRYYWDSVTGSVIAVAKEGVRVLQEIMPGAKKAAPARTGQAARPTTREQKQEIQGYRGRNSGRPGYWYPEAARTAEEGLRVGERSRSVVKGCPTWA
jgi:hypothetical protein